MDRADEPFEELQNGAKRYEGSGKWIDIPRRREKTETSRRREEVEVSNVVVEDRELEITTLG